VTTLWHLPYEHDRPLPETTATEVRTVPALAQRLVERETAPGDTVFDPFAGFGTTLRTATDCDREAWGIEYERERVAYTRDAVPDGTVIHGDARSIADYDLPTVDAVVTSPPLMTAGMERDLLQNYAGESDYASYLDAVAGIFEQVGDCLAPGGTVALHVVNVKHEGEVTPLAWDLADAIGRHLHFEGEIVVDWKPAENEPAATGERVGDFGYGYDHSYVLRFSNA